MTLPRRLTWLAPALLAVALLTACGSGSDNTIAQPGSWGPSYGGQTYCAYVVSPLECTGHPGIPLQMPMTAPAGYYPGMSSPNSLLTALFLQHLIYHSFYGSPGYYNHYVPAAQRNNYTTVYVNNFDRKYGAAEKQAESKAVYKNSKGKTVPPGKVNLNKVTAPKTRTCGMAAGAVTGVLSKGGSGSSGGGSRGGGSRSGGGSKSRPSTRTGGSSKKGGC